MLELLIVEGPRTGERFSLDGTEQILGRDANARIRLTGNSVSRQHARILCVGGAYFIEDMQSRNGTYLKGQPIHGRAALTAGDRMRLGEFVLEFCQAPSAQPIDTELIIREQIDAAPSNHDLYAQNPAQKLQIVLEIAQELGTLLDTQTLLDRLLGHLLKLFPRADRGMVILTEGERLQVRAQRSRQRGDADFPYSRTIVRHALAAGAGLLSDDVGTDARFGESETVAAMAAHSLLCVPLIPKSGQRLGVLQLDQAQEGPGFQTEDLRLLTTLALQVAVVLENVTLQAQRLREEGLRKELAMAREIQQGFLPSDFMTLGDGRYQLFASVEPAREVSGDFYDYFTIADGRLAFFLGDVSGKGMPAALFMVAVRTLARHLTARAAGPAETLVVLNDSLAVDNPSSMFVTLAHGLYDPHTGEAVLASGGHPSPLLRRPDGSVEEIAVPAGRVLGCVAGGLTLTPTRLTLAPGETLIYYTDGFTEAFAPGGDKMFGLERLRAALGGGVPGPPAALAEKACKAVSDFTRSRELQDDQTLFLLRRT